MNLTLVTVFKDSITGTSFMDLDVHSHGCIQGLIGEGSSDSFEVALICMV